MHGMPGPLHVPPDSDVFPEQLQRIGALRVQVRLQRYRPPVAEPIEGRLVRGRHSFALGVVIFQFGTGGCNGPCRADKVPRLSVVFGQLRDLLVMGRFSRGSRLYFALRQLAPRRGTARQSSSVMPCARGESGAGHIAGRETWRCVAGQACAAASPQSALLASERCFTNARK